MSKYYPCKVGTIPALVQLRNNYKLKIGKEIIYRIKGEKDWKKGKIVKIHNDGWFMLEKMRRRKKI